MIPSLPVFGQYRRGPQGAKTGIPGGVPPPRLVIHWKRITLCHGNQPLSLAGVIFTTPKHINHLGPPAKIRGEPRKRTLVKVVACPIFLPYHLQPLRSRKIRPP